MGMFNCSLKTNNNLAGYVMPILELVRRKEEAGVLQLAFVLGLQTPLVQIHNPQISWLVQANRFFQRLYFYGCGVRIGGLILLIIRPAFIIICQYGFMFEIAIGADCHAYHYHDYCGCIKEL